MESDARAGAAEWVVLWVQTGREAAVIETLKGLLDGGLYAPFAPKVARPIVRKGKVVTKTVKACFPGYVFMRVHAGAGDFFRDVYRLPSVIKGAYRFAYYGTDTKDVLMRRHEREQLESLMNEEFVMEESVGFMEGDRVRVKEGPLVGKESSIVRVNKRQRRAIIATEMMGRVVEMELMLDVVERV